MTNFDDLKLAVEALSGGKNTVKFDDLGMPSILVPFPRLNYSDVIDGGTQEALPAFIVDGQEKDVIYVSKYQNIIVNDRAYSLPFYAPHVGATFDNARTYSRNKGVGWHLSTNALWAAISLWCKKNGTLPNGNNNYGHDINHPHEVGIVGVRNSQNKVTRIKTGSGPNTWYHNHNSTTGIADMNGNGWERVGGLRLQNGEIQIIPNNDAANDTPMLQNVDSTAWRAILADGSLVEPSTAGTLKFDYISNKITLSTTVTTVTSGAPNTKFEQIVKDENVSAIPQVLKGLGIYPADATGYADDYVRMENTDERIALRGGGHDSGVNAGVFSLHLGQIRSTSVANQGSGICFRAAYFE